MLVRAVMNSKICQTPSSKVVEQQPTVARQSYVRNAPSPKAVEQQPTATGLSRVNYAHSRLSTHSADIIFVSTLVFVTLFGFVVRLLAPFTRLPLHFGACLITLVGPAAPLPNSGAVLKQFKRAARIFGLSNLPRPRMRRVKRQGLLKHAAHASLQWCEAGNSSCACSMDVHTSYLCPCRRTMDHFCNCCQTVCYSHCQPSPITDRGQEGSGSSERFTLNLAHAPGAPGRPWWPIIFGGSDSEPPKDVSLGAVTPASVSHLV
jgi:hypothetical protein